MPQYFLPLVQCSIRKTPILTWNFPVMQYSFITMNTMIQLPLTCNSTNLKMWIISINPFYDNYDSILLQAGNSFLFPVVQAHFVGEQWSANTNQVQSALDMSSLPPVVPFTVKHLMQFIWVHIKEETASNRTSENKTKSIQTCLLMCRSLQSKATWKVAGFLNLSFS